MLEEKDDNLQPEADGSEKNSETPQIDNQESVTTEETVSEGEVTADAEGENNDDPQNEIDESNAEDAEDEGHKERHEIPMLDYHAMNMDTLVEELNILITKEKIQAIKSHVDQIKSEFDLKFQELLEQKKEDRYIEEKKVLKSLGYIK